jgi:hypothetical protein
LFVVGIFALYLLVSGVHRISNEGWDFVPVYSGVRCLLHGCNPYSTPQLNREFLRAGGSEQLVDYIGGWGDETPLYPPSTFVALAPLGLLSFPSARLVWCLLNYGLFLIAVWLVLRLCPPTHSWLATAFAAVFLFDASGALKLGQASGFAVATLVISGALFMLRRRPLLAACLLMLSLAVKPHIGGLVALYFLATRVHRRYAAIALSGAAAFLLLGGLILYSRPASAHWVSDLHSSLITSMAPGGVNDPASPNPWEINLLPLTVILFPDPETSQAIAYGIFLLLAAAWGLAARRTGADSSSELIVLGALVVLSVLPVYHRNADATILLLAVPSLVIIFQRSRTLGTVMAALTVMSTSWLPSSLNAFLTAHDPALLQTMLRNKYLVFLALGRASDLHPGFQHMLGDRLAFALTLRQQNIDLLLLACLYLIALFRTQQSQPAAEAELTAASGAQVS